jgi:hypothetical protein
MKTSSVTVQPIRYIIPFIPPTAGTNMKVGTWICEFCDSQWHQSQKRCGTCNRQKGGKRSIYKKDNQEPTVSKDKEKKRGRKHKTLPPPPAQEVDVPLLVGSVSCSPLAGINANDSSIGPSIGMSSYEDANIGDDTAARDSNDDLI